jgi:hypothetical protein
MKLYRYLAVVCLALPAFTAAAQSQQPAYYADLPFKVTLTEDQYWASQPVVVQALRNMSSADRADQALILAKRGYKIDVPIMVWGWGAVGTMVQRQVDGITWTPSALQPNIQPYLIAGQVAINPPFVPYDPTTPPPGSILVSADAGDYPPIVKPAPAIPAASNLVGARNFGNVYFAGPGAMKDSQTANVTDGQQVPQGGLNCIAHVARELMGLSVYFTCQ